MSESITKVLLHRFPVKMDYFAGRIKQNGKISASTTVQAVKAIRETVLVLAIDNAERSSQRYVPSGCAVLAFHRGDKIYSTLHQEMQPRSSLCGQSVSYTDVVYSGNLNLVMVVFQPVAGTGCIRDSYE